MNLRAILLFFTLMAWQHAAFASPGQYQKERVLYQQAMLALQGKNQGKYQELRSQLKNYPLASYLDYEYLRRNFARTPVANIKSFLDSHKGYYIAKRLQIEWLGYLANNAKWQLFTEFYDPAIGSDSLQCSAFEAELALGDDANDASVYPKISAHWLKPYTLPSACDSLFAKWQNLGYKTSKLIWKRYQLAYSNKDDKLLNKLTTQLTSAQIKTVKKLNSAPQNIDYWLDEFPKNQKKLAIESKVLKQVFIKLTNADNEKVARFLETQHLIMDKTDLIEVQKLVVWYIAKNSGNNSGTKAVQWLQKYADIEHPLLTEPLLRYALQDNNWTLYKDIFKTLPAAQKNQEEWLYWYAIAQEKLNSVDSDPALTPKFILEKIAQEQSFYGFLAAEKNKSKIFPKTMLTAQKDDVSVDIKNKLAASIELYNINELAMSNNDWSYTTSKFTDDEWRQAGIIAYQMNWIPRTIQAFGRAKLWTAAEERFPILFRDHFYENAIKQGIDPGWILAVARQESGFSPTAKSPVGALGVLQIMPTTAAKIAKKMNVRYSQQKLLDPAYNIALGTKYLRDQLNNYDNNYILATAAYNAGPGKVKEWLTLRPITEDWSQWVATIPYKETRGYVQNILTYSKIYNMKLEANKVAQLEAY